jgi:hypothetical protein
VIQDETFPARSTAVQVMLLVEFNAKGNAKLKSQAHVAVALIVETQLVSVAVAPASVAQSSKIVARLVLRVQVWLSESVGTTLSWFTTRAWLTVVRVASVAETRILLVTF